MSVTFCETVDAAFKEYGRVRPLLLASLEHGDGRFTEETIIRGIGKGEFLLVTSENAAVIVQVIVTLGSDVKILFVPLGGGDLKEIAAAVPELKAWGAARGCTILEASGRPGWRKALGFKFASENSYIEI